MFGNRFTTFLLAILLCGAMHACDPWFSFSPYAASLPERYHDANERNLSRIKARSAGDSKPFKIAVISDPHYHYSKLRDAVNSINSNGEYEFVIVVGDLSENGLMQEFIYFYQVMEGLKIPYVTAIGNHDYLANGEKVYRQMYGTSNYTFIYNNCKFVMWDNTVWESGKEPDIDWFAAQFEDASGMDHILPVAHIPPYDAQMNEYRERYRGLIQENGLDLSIHGHKHSFSIQEVSGVRYLTVSSPQERAYTELSITPAAIDVQKIEY